MGKTACGLPSSEELYMCLLGSGNGGITNNVVMARQLLITEGREIKTRQMLFASGASLG